jgi:hypothetical protein
MKHLKMDKHGEIAGGHNPQQVGCVGFGVWRLAFGVGVWRWKFWDAVWKLGLGAGVLVFAALFPQLKTAAVVRHLH